jgi:HB1, ASXL, restriction endonuclease HTH domain
VTATPKLTAREAIVQVLGSTTKSMKVPAIIAAAVPLTGLSGKTSGQSIYTVLYSASKKPDAPFVQVGRGEFKLAKAPTASKPAAVKATPAARKPRARKVAA